MYGVWVCEEVGRGELFCESLVVYGLVVVRRRGVWEEFSKLGIGCEICVWKGVKMLFYGGMGYKLFFVECVKVMKLYLFLRCCSMVVGVGNVRLVV